MKKIYLSVVLCFLGMVGFAQTGPTFFSGPSQTLGVCENSTAYDISAYLMASDPDIGDMETYSLVDGPSNGSVSGLPITTTSPGGMIMVSGVSYTPDANFSGLDTFVVMLNDGMFTDVMTIYITVNPQPVITGTLSVCDGHTTTLSADISAGTWYSSNTSAATIGTAGVVYGVAGGTSDITYTAPVTGCYNYVTVSVNSTPLPSAGPGHVCVSSMITLTNSFGGGVWTSSTPSVATVGSSDGIVTGVAAGSTDITYTWTNGCYINGMVTVHALPTTSGGSDLAICYGNSAMLTGTGADEYSWSPADGLSCTSCTSPSASPTVTTTYTVTGTKYHVTNTIVYNENFFGGVAPTTQCTNWDIFRSGLTSTNYYIGFTIRGSNNTTGISCTDPAVANAVAAALRTGTVYAGSSDGETWRVGTGCGTGCGSGAVELTNTGSTCNCGSGYTIRPNINNHNWGGIDGPTCSASSQTMEVIFYVGEGCSNTSTVTVTVNPLPASYNVTGGGSYCEGGTGVEVRVDTSNGGIRYQLYNGMTSVGSLMDGVEDTVSFGMQTAAGTYTVEAVDTMTGCINMMSGSATVTITPTVIPTVAIFRSTGDTICEGTATAYGTYVTNGGSNPTYIWKVNGATAGIDSFGHGFTPGVGTSRVSVIVVSDEACPVPDTVMSDTMTTIVWPNGRPTITLAASPNDTVCEGTTVTINPTVTFGGYWPTFVWVKNASVVSTSSSYTFTPINGDNIYAVVNSTYMCRDTDAAYSNVVDMTVVDPVVPSVSILATPGVNVFGIADTFTANVTNGGTNPSYQWYFNGTIVAGATNSVYIRSTVAHKDSITVKVTRNDACGLSTINSVVINGKVGVPGVVGGVTLALVPNPNNGVFSVTGSMGLVADEQVTATVTNMLGQTVYTNGFMTENGNINAQITTANLANGQYMLTLHSTAGNSVYRFVVQH